MKEVFGFTADIDPSIDKVLECICVEDRDRFLAHLNEAKQDTAASRLEHTLCIRRADDERERWVALNGWKTVAATSETSRIVMTVRDVTEDKTAQERIRWSANHDPLTGLANRVLFQKRLDQALRAADHSGGSVGLLLLDLDEFKQINDTLGHDAGDAILQLVAQRLQSTVCKEDTVARLGGDEFAIVMPNLKSQENLSDRSQAILRELERPWSHGSRIIDCHASIGASMHPEHSQTSEQLLKNGDMALYAAKAAGRSTVVIFEPKLRIESQQRLSMLQSARNALRSDSVVPYYQPKLELRNGNIVGFEALLRWRGEDGRIRFPATIKAAFDDLDLAEAISDRMIERTIADMRTWLDQDIQFGHVAVNASAAEFRRDHFAERVLEQLSNADIPPHHFQLEVTETVFIGRGAEYVHRALGLLSSNGVEIALDDFGTGFASLRHLKEFPINSLKIDRSFIGDADDDSDDDAIIRAVIHLGRSLGIKVVAEGIESQAQSEWLRAVKCDYGQGFFFSKAVPSSEVPGLIGRFSPKATPELIL